MTDLESFVRANTRLVRASLVPEIALHLADEITPIWHATEDWLAARNVDPPFWAFAWPGSQALARQMLDHPEQVRGKRVLDFAAGCGVAAIAAAQAGAAVVEAAEIDPLAGAAIRLNAIANGVEVSSIVADLVGAACRWDVIVSGDIFYERPMSAHVHPWLTSLAARAAVWVADPGRAYLPGAGLDAFGSYCVPTSLELEDRTERVVTLYRLRAGTPEMMIAQSAFWVGLLYDEPTLTAAEALLRGMTWQDAVALREAVPRQGLNARLNAPWRGQTARALAREAVALARQGLRARRRLDAAGRDESVFVAPLEAIADGAPTQAEHWLARYNGPWNGDPRRIFTEAEV